MFKTLSKHYFFYVSTNNLQITMLLNEKYNKNFSQHQFLVVFLGYGEKLQLLESYLNHYVLFPNVMVINNTPKSLLEAIRLTSFSFTNFIQASVEPNIFLERCGKLYLQFYIYWGTILL